MKINIIFLVVFILSISFGSSLFSSEAASSSLPVNESLSAKELDILKSVDNISGLKDWIDARLYEEYTNSVDHIARGWNIYHRHRITKQLVEEYKKIMDKIRQNDKCNLEEQA